MTDKVDDWREKKPGKRWKKKAVTGHLVSQSGTGNQQPSIRTPWRGSADWKVEWLSEYLIAWLSFLASSAKLGDLFSRCLRAGWHQVWQISNKAQGTVVWGPGTALTLVYWAWAELLWSRWWGGGSGCSRRRSPFLASASETHMSNADEREDLTNSKSISLY